MSAIKKYTVSWFWRVGALISCLFVGCLFSGCVSLFGTASDTHPARVTVDMEVVAPEALCKTGQVVLTKILVKMVSSKNDTVFDEITQQGSLISRDPDTFLAGTVASQIVSAQYDLVPDRNWIINSWLIDNRDSVRNLDTIKVPHLNAFESRTVAMCLHPRLTAYSAYFFLPSEIRVRETTGHDAESRTAIRNVYFTRINLMDEDRVMQDSSAIEGQATGFHSADPSELYRSEHSVFFPSGSFGETPSVNIEDDYVNTGRHTFTLNAYGYIQGDTVGVTPLRLLFKGSQQLNTTLAKEAGSVAMEWQATDITVQPDTVATSRLKVVLGHVGTIIVNVRISGELNI